MDFQQINLIDQLQRALADAGYVEPTPIQIQTIPPALEGKDILHLVIDTCHSLICKDVPRVVFNTLYRSC